MFKYSKIFKRTRILHFSKSKKPKNTKQGILTDEALRTNNTLSNNNEGKTYQPNIVSSVKNQPIIAMGVRKPQTQRKNINLMFF